MGTVRLMESFGEARAEWVGEGGEFGGVKPG